MHFRLCFPLFCQMFYTNVNFLLNSSVFAGISRRRASAPVPPCIPIPSIKNVQKRKISFSRQNNDYKSIPIFMRCIFVVSMSQKYWLLYCKMPRHSRRLPTNCKDLTRARILLVLTPSLNILRTSLYYIKVRLSASNWPMVRSRTHRWMLCLRQNSTTGHCLFSTCPICMLGNFSENSYGVMHSYYALCSQALRKTALSRRMLTKNICVTRMHIMKRRFFQKHW